MPKDSDVLANVEATLDGLSDPTPEEAYDALLRFETPMVAAAAARRALAGGGGGGGSMPSWWTIVDTPGSESATLAGRLIVTAPGQDKTLTIVGDKNSANDAIVVTDSDNPGSIAFGVDPFGYIVGLGIAVGGADLRLLEVDAVLAGRTNRVVSIVGGATDLFVIDKDGDIQMGNLPSSAPAKSKTLWSDSGVLTVTA